MPFQLTQDTVSNHVICMCEPAQSVFNIRVRLFNNLRISQRAASEKQALGETLVCCAVSTLSLIA